MRPASRFGVPLNIRHADHWYAEHALEKLVEPSEDQAGANEPLLATRWELSPDKSSYTFYLRKGIKFHDGSDFNAQAVKWNLDKVLATPNPVSALWESIEVIDDYTLLLNLKEWDNQVLAGLASDKGFLISPTAYEKNGEDWANTHPVGTGPWIMTDYARNLHVKYEKNEDYWGQVPYLDELEVLHIQDPMTYQAAFLKGDVDILYSVDPITAGELEKTGKYTVLVSDGPGNAILFHSADPESVWSNQKMREALEYAIDKEKIVETLMHGYGTPAYEIIKGIHDAGVEPGTTPRTYNPEKAKQLIAEAGYAEGIKVEYTVNAMGPQEPNIAVQSQLAEVGIEIELNPVTETTFVKLGFEPPTGNDLRGEAQRGGPGNPLQGAKESFSEKSMYFAGVEKPAGFQELLQEALHKDDPAEALEIAAKLDKLAYENAMFVPLWGAQFIHIVHPYVEDAILMYGGGPHPKLQYAWLNE